MTGMDRRRRRLLLVVVALVVLFAAFILTHPRGFSVYVVTIWANQGVLLALAAIAQFFVVIVRGIDLSIGSIIALTNVAASYLVFGTPGEIAFGIVVVLALGVLCGFLNGLVVVFGRVEPIVATLATGAIYGGIALLWRPIPGGEIDDTLGDLLTYDVNGVPTSLIVLVVVLVAISIPLRRTRIGLSMLAVGSSEQSAFLTGIQVRVAKLVAYSLAGLFGALTALYIAFVTLTGDPAIGPAYTLNSIAAVVLGGVPLTGGVGAPLLAVLGALILKTISSLMFFTGIPPLAQSFFEGLVLAVAIGIGAIDALRSRSKLKVYE
ncbi:MAG: ABC transporter permease [Rhizobiales bacterium]|nr:ABC transporter permease [Hyphomicrobiales bacterium]